MSLRRTSFVPSSLPQIILYNYIHSFIGPEVIVETDNMMFDIEKACEVAKEILKKHFAKLGTLLHHELLQKVTQRMFAAGLVSQAVNNSPDYNNLMGEYFVMLELCNDHPKFIEYC